jgi:hypothetical protein
MNETDKCHVMIDLETLGIKSNAVILSIGAVQFDLKGNIKKRFHQGIHIDSCLERGLQVDGSTIEWWLKQSKENTEKLLAVPRQSLVGVLDELTKCFKLLDKEKICVWSHGSDFDIVLLENAYKACSRDTWWKYSHVRDTRTLFDLANYKYKAIGSHDALEDAMNQVEAVVKAYQQLNQRKEASYKVQFLLDNYIEVEDGKFCFPDGDIWDVKRRA